MVERIMNIRCNYCGKFISYQDIINEKAIHQIEPPLTEFSDERYESVCNKCLNKHQNILTTAMQTIYGTSLVKF